MNAVSRSLLDTFAVMWCFRCRGDITPSSRKSGTFDFWSAFAELQKNQIYTFFWRRCRACNVTELSLTDGNALNLHDVVRSLLMGQLLISADRLGYNEFSSNFEHVWELGQYVLFIACFLVSSSAIICYCIHKHITLNVWSLLVPWLWKAHLDSLNVLIVNIESCTT